MKKLLIIFLLLPLFSFAQSARDYFDKGNELVHERKYTEALQAYNRAIALKPDYAEAYKQRARTVDIGLLPSIVKRRIIDYENIISDYTIAINLNPNDADAYYRRAEAKNYSKDYQGSLEDYKRSTELNPNNWNAYVAMAGINQQLHRYDDAVKNYTTAIYYDKKYSYADYFNRAGVKCEMGDYKGAIEDFNQSIKLNHSTITYSGRALAELKSGLYKEAIEDYTKDIDRRKGNKIYLVIVSCLYANRAEAKMKIEDFKGAMADYDVAIKGIPYIRFYNGRAEAKMNIGDKDGACLDWADAFKLGNRELTYLHKQDSLKNDYVYSFHIGDTIGLKTTILNIDKYCK